MFRGVSAGVDTRRNGTAVNGSVQPPKEFEMVLYRGLNPWPKQSLGRPKELAAERGSENDLALIRATPLLP